MAKRVTAKRDQEFAKDVAGTKRQKPSGKKESAGLEKMTRHKKSK